MEADRPSVPLLAAIFAGTFVSLLDLTIVNVALPTIQSDLRIDVAGAQWVVDAFALTLGALVISGGALGDRYGRKRLFIGALALFLAGSVVCAAASTPGVLLAGRVLQGLAAAVIVPGALSLIAQVAPDRRRRAQLIGVWGMVSSLAVVIGPLAGGLLVEVLDWQAIFYVNVPIVVAAIVVGVRTIPESADPERASLDPAGQALVICALGTLTYAVIEGRNHGWGSELTLALFAVAGVAALALVPVELRQSRPMLAVRMFQDSRFAIVLAASVALGFGGNGSFFVLALYLQAARGHSALTTGLMLTPLTLAVIPAAKLTGTLIAQHGARRPLLLGYAIAGASLTAMAAIGADTPYLPIALGLVAAGFGQGLAIPPAPAAVLEIVPRERSGIASATVTAARQVGTALGIAVLGTILAGRLDGAAPRAFADAFARGMQPALLISGVTVLAAAALLLALPRHALRMHAHAEASR